MYDVRGYPLIYWIMRRLQTFSKVVFATTEERSDDALAAYMRAADVPTYRGSTNDVLARMDGALRAYAPDAEFVLRGLGDCPFMAGELITRATDCLHLYGGEAFVWALPPRVLPVYGAREFPYSRNAWDKIVSLASGEEHEHIDMYFHRHRRDFKVLYHEAPPADYFREYRLEVDWLEDMQMVRELARGITMQSPLLKILEYLDKHPEVASMNRERVEKTGPSRVNQAERKSYYKAMRGKAIIGWDGNVWEPMGDTAEPVFCSSGQCLLGQAMHGVLYRIGGDQIRGDAMLSCKCGLTKRWQAAG
jgi:spore coat polysaccharide biosynthesis protein SpsF